MTAQREQDSLRGYHQFITDDDTPYGSFEVWWDCPGDDEPGATREAGWYWWACYPGCMPDGNAEGPYETSQAAFDAAQDTHTD